MRIIRLSIILILLVHFLINNGYGGKIVRAKYAGEFISTGVGARALGMGGTFVAISEDLTAGYWNPSALATLNYPQLAGMHAQRFANLVNYNYGAISLPVGSSSGLALSLIRLGVDDIPDTRYALEEIGDPNGILDPGDRIDPSKVLYFNSAEYALYLSYGMKRNSNFYYGGNVKVVHKGIGDNSAWGMGFDLACLWKPYSRLNIGVNLQDITTTLLVWDTGRQEAITPTIKIGTAYFWESTKIAGQIIPAFDVDIRFENRRYSAQYNLSSVSFDLHFGMEYRLKQLVALRLGLDTGRFTAGVGIKLPNLNVDYAFLSHEDLGNTHRVSLILTIKEKRFGRQ